MSRTQRRSYVAWLVRFVRGRRPDRNPLRRASDRIETAMLVVLVVAFAVAAPFAAQQSSAWVRATAHQVQLEQEASRHQVTAVVLKSAPGPEPGEFAVRAAQVPARWTAGGRATTGEVPVPAGVAAGATVLVWVTRDGQLTDQPLLDSQVAGQAFLAGILSVVALASLLAVTGTLTRRSLDKRRMAAWEAEWRASGPHWTARA